MFCLNQNVRIVKSTPLIIEAGAQKSRGACPQKHPGQSRGIFAATPHCFFAGAPAKKPGGVDFGNTYSLI
jgi:hypothetical protein